MNWLNRFMTGRYGVDQLSVSFLVLGCLLTLIGSITGVSALAYISYLPMGLLIYRSLSKDITKRRSENYKYMTLVSPVYSWGRKKFGMLKDADHKYLKCPYCNAQLRLPKGKGKISVTCPVCKKEFVKKT